MKRKKDTALMLTLVLAIGTALTGGWPAKADAASPLQITANTYIGGREAGPTAGRRPSLRRMGAAVRGLPADAFSYLRVKLGRGGCARPGVEAENLI